MEIVIRRTSGGEIIQSIQLRLDNFLLWFRYVSDVVIGTHLCGLQLPTLLFWFYWRNDVSDVRLGA